MKRIYLGRRLMLPAALLLVAAILFLWAQPGPRAQSDRRVDVMTICLEKSADSVTIEGISLHFFDAEFGELRYQTEGKQSHTIRAVGEGISVDGKIFDTTRLRIRSTQNWTRYGGRIFREELIAVNLQTTPARIALVNEVGLEPYLYGLINKECLASWDLEAKKAQAVAARTYALGKRTRAKSPPVCDLDSSALDQVYGGYNAEDSASRLAVDSTRGEVLTYNSRVAKAYYHANCGGHTASSEAIWNDPQPYLPAKSSPWAKDAPGYSWTYSIDKTKLARKLGIPAGWQSRFRFDIPKRSQSGRVMEVRLHYGDKTRTLSGEHFRKAVGYTNLKSTLFRFAIKGNTVTFSGNGMGHGVGMCQWSAAKMAAAGSDYTAILQYFYPGTELRRMY